MPVPLAMVAQGISLAAVHHVVAKAAIGLKNRRRRGRNRMGASASTNAIVLIALFAILPVHIISAIDPYLNQPHPEWAQIVSKSSGDCWEYVPDEQEVVLAECNSERKNLQTFVLDANTTQLKVLFVVEINDKDDAQEESCLEYFPGYFSKNIWVVGCVEDGNDVTSPNVQWYQDDQNRIRSKVNDHCITDIDGRLHVKACDDDNPAQEFSYSIHSAPVAPLVIDVKADETVVIDAKADETVVIDAKADEIETEAPTPIDTRRGGAAGDPHIVDWAGNTYDFMGACDLVLARIPGFANGSGLDIHIRTKIHSWWSYIDSLVLRIGEDTLEIKGGALQKQDDNPYWFNGERGDKFRSGKLGTKLGGFIVRYHFFTLFARQFRVNLGDGDDITVRVYKDFVSIRIKVETPEKFGGAMGLMGTYPSGTKVARDGVSVLDNMDAFGQEWQVQATEPKLFHALEGSQAPEQCAMPLTGELAAVRSRRLGESSLSRKEAEEACTGITLPQDVESCVEDVLVTNDKGMAHAYYLMDQV